MQYPKIGRYWGGHGGIYAGITAGKNHDSHLILAPEISRRDVIWREAVAIACAHSDDGKNDFRLPYLAEAALLYANLKHYFEDMWYWTADFYPPDNNCAWVQTFGYGRQADARLTDACRVCAVRIEPCE